MRRISDGSDTAAMSGRPSMAPPDPTKNPPQTNPSSPLTFHSLVRSASSPLPLAPFPVLSHPLSHRLSQPWSDPPVALCPKPTSSIGTCSWQSRTSALRCHSGDPPAPSPTAPAHCGSRTSRLAVGVVPTPLISQR